MNSNPLLSSIVTLIAIFSLQGCGVNQPDGRTDKPNIIYILADDLGLGDLGYNGQEQIKTPNIDRLAAGGMQFTDHYSGSTVCAPSRSVLMTGQHSGHTYIRNNRPAGEEGQYPLEAGAFTIAEMLKQKGYVTGAFGKWGLGFIGTEGDPNAQGFDEFFGYNCQKYAHRYYPEYLWHNNEKVFLPGNDWTSTVTYAPDVIHEKALEFIKANRDKPFFLYYPSTIPHAELIAPEDDILEQYMGKFTETPYLGGKASGDVEKAAYGPLMDVAAYCPQEHPKAVYAAMVSRLDRHVGEVMETLQKLGIEKNTLVIFTSDNGPHYEGGINPDMFNSNGIYRGGKRDLYEGGIRAPMIASWPGKIEKGSKTDHISGFWDVMPTLAQVAGIQVPKNSDGISFLPTLTNEGAQEKHDHLYWEFHGKGGKQAVRQGKWKIVKLNCFSPENSAIELYDLENDPSEETNIAAEHPGKVEELLSIIETEHVESEVFPFAGVHPIVKYNESAEFSIH